MNEVTKEIYDYGVFTPVVYGNSISIHTCDINNNTIDEYISNLKDIFLDYIEVKRVQNNKIEFIFDNEMKVRLPS